MSRYAFSRSVAIAASPQRVLERITRFPEWRAWSPFEGADPELRRTYRGAEQGAGAIYEWSGNAQAGAGIMTITSATDSRVTIELQFLRPFKSVSHHTFDVVPDGAATRVTWTMAGELKGFTGWLMRVMMPMEKGLGPQFERGLAALKRVVEHESAD